jgi:hypothetical protein
MERSAKARQGVRFDAFEVDLEERELRRSGPKSQNPGAALWRTPDN